VKSISISVSFYFCFSVIFYMFLSGFFIMGHFFLIFTKMESLSKKLQIWGKSCQLDTTSYVKVVSSWHDFVTSVWSRVNLVRLLPRQPEVVPSWHDFVHIIFFFKNFLFLNIYIYIYYNYLIIIKIISYVIFEINLVCADNCFYCDLRFCNMNIFFVYLKLNHLFHGLN